MKERGNISGISHTLTRQSGKSRTRLSLGQRQMSYGGNPSTSGFFSSFIFSSLNVKNTLRDQTQKSDCRKYTAVLARGLFYIS